MSESTLMETDPVQARLIIQVILDELDALVVSDRFGRHCEVGS